MFLNRLRSMELIAKTLMTYRVTYNERRGE
jgi:hypothetical protein